MNTLILLLSLTVSDTTKPDPKGPKLEPEKTFNPVGYYKINGAERQKDGTMGKYTGIVTLRKINEVWVATWSMSGGNSFAGIGIMKGDTLTIGWAQGTAKGVTFLTHKGRNWHGTWAVMPSGGFQNTENWTWLSELDKEEDE